MTVRTLFTKVFCYLSTVHNWGLYIFVTLFTGEDYFFKVLVLFSLQLKTPNLQTWFTVENVSPACLQVRGGRSGRGA